ncbi:MAG: NADH:flavin oxidoreductase [Cellvibrionales bacterium]|nr:NADH:flavin oxidoreductase [Cellvibrionales bacterium]
MPAISSQSKLFPHLSKPGEIGALSVKNRMVVTAMGVNLAEDDGVCGDRIIAFHERHAKGGAGLIVLGVAGVAWPHGGNQPNQVAISDDRFIPGLKAMADAVHRHGAKLATQLHHGGLVATEDMRSGRPVWVPSYPEAKKPSYLNDFLDHELMAMHDPKAPKPSLKPMSHEDIDLLVRQFAAAAIRAKTAGIDALEIHGGHGYIISEFLSPAMNKREDEYGGSHENRARLLLRIIGAVRQAVGHDFPVWCKLDSGEFGNEKGIRLADAKATALLAQAAGVDAVTVSAYHDTSQGIMHSESNIPHTPERLVSNAIAIKQLLDIPVITSGRIEPHSADRHIGQQHFDFFGMGRKLLADPDLPNKVVAGTPEQIRPCVYCYCCVSQIYIRQSVKCAVNPETAFERERSLIASSHANNKHYVVIGGGPGGMEISRRLDSLGYRVTLLEKSNRLGGTLQFASIAYPPNEKLLNWLKLQIKQSNVTVKLNCEASPELLSTLQADEVIVATGAKRDMPEIEGNDQDFVFSGDEMRALVLAESNPTLRTKTSAFTRFMTYMGAKTGVTGWPTAVYQASKIWLPLPKKIVIIGSELVGLELAEFLAERGREVTVIDKQKKPGKGLYIVRRLRLLTELKALGVNIINQVSDIRIADHQVLYTDNHGQQYSIDAKQVIVAQGASGDQLLVESLAKAGHKVHSIGDCNGVGYIEGAIEAAAELAVQLHNNFPIDELGIEKNQSGTH